MELARETATAVDEAVLERTWPEIGDRLLRPGAIVSVDIVRGVAPSQAAPHTNRSSGGRTRRPRGRYSRYQGEMRPS